MENHPIPRQITTFEFKLIGFMTLTQFIYLVVFIPLAYIVLRTFPVPILNVLLAAIIAGLGLALAFLPVNGRPLDVWLRNLIKRMMSPTQYVYNKQNTPVAFLDNLYFDSDPHKVEAHVQAQQKLSQYLTQKKQAAQTFTPLQVVEQIPQKQQVIEQMLAASSTPQPAAPAPRPVDAPAPSAVTGPKQPFFTGMVKNVKEIPLAGILIYVKDTSGTPLRLLKSNPYGVFATYNTLPVGQYLFEVKDPKGVFKFDTMNVSVQGVNTDPIEIRSKELS